MNDPQCRIRIKLENGAEMEATGSLEYVRGEREAFFARYGTAPQEPPAAAEEWEGEGELEERTKEPEPVSPVPRSHFSPRHHRHPPIENEGTLKPGVHPEEASRPARGAGIRSPIWDSVIEVGPGPSIQLRAKLRNDKTDKDACLLLLMAAHKVLNLQKPTASQLARWLRSSGYPVQRVDRALADALSQGEIMASGSRRARRYELTGPGRVKGFVLAQQMTQLVHGDNWDE